MKNPASACLGSRKIKCEMSFVVYENLRFQQLTFAKTKLAKRKVSSKKSREKKTRKKIEFPSNLGSLGYKYHLYF